MKLFKDKDSGVYKAEIQTVQGKRRTITTKQKNIDDAKQVVKDSKLREIELAAQAGCLTNQAVGLILAGKKMTVAKAVDEWRAWMLNIGRSPTTIENHTTFLNAWANAAGVLNVPPSAVTEKHISQWINSQEDESKLSSRAVKLSAIRSFFEYCAAKGYTIGNPSKLVRITYHTLSHSQKETKERAPLNDQEVEALLDETEGFWHAAIAISRWAGLRLGDIAKLEWDSLGKPGKIIVWTDKRDRRIELDLHPRLAQIVASLPKHHRIYVFPEQRETATDPKKRSILSTQFGRLCRRVGVKGHSFHDLRSSYCSEMDRKGVPIEHIARSVGHKVWDPYSVTRGYIKES